jgi:hypothetical protein
MKRLLLFITSLLLVCAVSLPIISLSTSGSEAVDFASLLRKGTGCYVDGSYLLGVHEKQTADDIKALFNSTEISVIKSNTYVGTGSKVRLDNKELTIVVKGDIDGDGIIDSLDYLMIKRAILGTLILSDEYYKATCVNGESEPSSLDYLLVKKHCIGTYNIFDEIATANFNGTKVAYIPLDDRPVNIDRVKYLAQSAGFDLLMPNADYYATKLDGNGTNSNGTKYGNREELVKWLKQVDAQCDYFVISLDQILSGGLVNSRSQNNTDLSYEYSIIDYLSELSTNNKVYFFDTVMRLASTVNYNGYQMTEYNETRTYGQIGRKILSGSALTVDGIIEGYRYNESGSQISTKLTEDQISSYLSARARKLHLADYFLTKLNGKYQYCYYGVDDSSPHNTIQTNEINYITSKLVKGKLFAGCDEIGMLCITRLTSDIYANSLKIAVNYFGGGENSPADSYDIGTLKQNIEHHIESVDSVITTGKADLSILVLTKPVSSTLSASCNALITKLQDNISKQIPTIVIDASTQSKKGTLQNLFSTKSIPLSTLVGYSNWNTVGNSVGIALSQGVTRTIYLKYCIDVTEDSNLGFIKSMTFAYIKDIGYLNDSDRKFNNFVSDKSYVKWLTLINYSPIITDLKTYKTKNMGTVSVSNFRQPWNRSFEITFDISVK